MNYEFDWGKLATNFRNHKIWFQSAQSFEWETALIKVDSRQLYPETRFEQLDILVKGCMSWCFAFD